MHLFIWIFLALNLLLQSAAVAAPANTFASCAVHPYSGAVSDELDDEDVGADSVDWTKEKLYVENRCRKPIRVVMCCNDEEAFNCSGSGAFKVVIVPPKGRTKDRLCEKPENARINGCFGESRVLAYEYVREGIKVTCGP